MTFNELMREARLYRGLNYKELAAKMGRNPGANSGGYISSIERGKVKPNYTVLAEIADALEITVSYRPNVGWGWRPNNV